MWDAVQRSDANYDGVFFYAVKTTGIFCRPSCKSKLPRRENLCYFSSGEEARAALVFDHANAAAVICWNMSLCRKSRQRSEENWIGWKRWMILV